MIVIGGWSDDGPTDSVLHVHVENQTAKWGRPLPVAVAAHTATLVKDYVYVIGGLKRDSGISNVVYKYVISTEMWQKVSTKGRKFPGVRLFSSTGVGSSNSNAV